MANKVMNVRMTPTKQSLIDAFLKLVSLKDFEKITIADITQGAKVNRATFYAHFTDKYELLDHIMGDSAAVAVRKYLGEKQTFEFSQAGIGQLVLAVCDYYLQPDVQCRNSYVAFVVPQLKTKMIQELRACLHSGLNNQAYPDEVKNIYVSIAAEAVHSGAVQWVTGESALSKEEFAEKVALFVIKGFQGYAMGQSVVY